MSAKGIAMRTKQEEGSALILAALVTVILSLLGLSYTMMAQTENTIAENERNSAVALYAAGNGKDAKRPPRQCKAMTDEELEAKIFRRKPAKVDIHRDPLVAALFGEAAHV